MQYISLNEKRQHGTVDFPFDFHHIDASHPRYYMNYHWHSEYELIRILQGTLHMTLNEKDIDACAGDLVFVHGGILHSGIPDQCVYECLVFDLGMFRKCCASCSSYIDRIINHSALVYHHFTGSYDELTQITDRLFDSFLQQRPGYEIAVIGYMYQFIAEVFAGHYYLDSEPVSSGKDARRILKLKKVVDYMNANISSPITLEQLSDVASMSPRYFCRFFHEMTHQKPIDYLNRQRIEKACNLLTDSDSSVTNIALSCGFNDVSYFIRTFRRYTGTTPGKYRKNQ